MYLMTTTNKTVTDQQIKQLRTEASEAGDMEQIIICDVALGMTWDEVTSPDYSAASPTELRSVANKLADAHLTMSAKARAECERVIAEAAAQGPDFERYAKDTAADIGGDRAAAVRAMRDEPGEVAKALGCTAEEVVDWCEAQAHEVGLRS